MQSILKDKYYYFFFFGASPLHNYRLTETHFACRDGAKTRYKNNVTAIRLLQELDNHGLQPNRAQQDVLAKYVGWGGLAQAFDQSNEIWRNEYTELRALLSERDYRLARESVLSAFYTPKTVIDAVYAGLKRLGFTSGRVLEPAVGTGHFIGLAPSDFNIKFYGVELDGISGKLAKYLYPKAEIQITGFENTAFADNFFDAVVTNIPFGAFKVFDPAYEKHNLFVHDYFILKCLDKIKPGGIAAIVTSKGTLDKANPYARKLFAERADLIDAIRLPNNAFTTTEVTSDILFLQKRLAPVTNSNSTWLDTTVNADGISINRYFADHPEMLLGRMVRGKSMYGGEIETACLPDGRDLVTALSTAILNLPKKTYTKPQTQHSPKEPPVPTGAVPQDLRLNALTELRKTVRHILDIQINSCSDFELASAQQKLNMLYDRFKKSYGAVNSKQNRRLFRNDTDFTLLLSIEDYDEVTGAAKKTDIFTKRTIRKYIRPESAGSALEALYISKNETGKVDFDVICGLTGKNFAEAVSELDGHIFRNPVGCNMKDPRSGWETASEYLSGNVRQKLRAAQSIAQTYPEFERNIEALMKVQPAPLTASEISVRIGARWVKPEIYRDFILERFQVSDVTVSFNCFTAEWTVEGGFRSFQVTNTYGTPRVNGYRIFAYALNLQTPSVYDTIHDPDGGERRVINRPETIAAREKLRIIHEEFKAWVFDDPERRQELVDVYNERFNNLVLASYDGSYLTFPEMNPNIELKDYQKDAVERIITSGNTLLHHVVGAGKTYEVAATAMKLRQLKLAQKPMIVVPNHLTYQWASEFKTLYPTAKLLLATKNDFEKENRLKFVSRIATGDWDAVVIAMSSFEKLPISKERQERKIQAEIDDIETALLELKSERNKRTTVKDLERVLKNKTAALKALVSGKKDNLIKFEDLGVDYLFIDEAHKFKNKFIFTKMNNVAGISKAMSKRSTDLDMKISYITELHGGQKGVVFATGTPISNSMVEMYTMQSYLAKQDLEDAGLNFFDDWAAVFGETQTVLELAPSGQGYRTKTRFAKFVNLPEMLKMYRKFADVKTSDMLNLPVPKANRHVITIKPTEEILRLNEVIVERAEKINAKAVKPEVDNMLKITGDGKKLALDPRCFSPSALNDDGLKVNVCARNVYRVWSETRFTRKTQLVFCDLSTPKCAFKDYDPTRDFDVYNHVKYVLTRMGVPESEIAFIHDAGSDVAKQTMFGNVRSGKIRILLGSTEKCGAGTNVQNRLVAIHHLDTPYRPADMAQREGRGIRQGNENAEIDIYTYVTERTFDAYSYQILENKQRFISQINRGELTVREASDIDESTFTYAEIKAIVSANPLIKRKNEIEVELSRLRVLQTQYRNGRYGIQDNVSVFLPKDISRLETVIDGYVKDIARRDANAVGDFSMTVYGRRFTVRADAAELYRKLCSNAYAGKVIAEMYGFEIIPDLADDFLNKTVTVKGSGSYTVQVSQSAVGSITRLENFFKSMEDGLCNARRNLEIRKAELVSAKAELDKPFEHEEIILTLSAELGEIETQLDLDKKEIAAVMDEEPETETAEIETETDDKDE